MLFEPHSKKQDDAIFSDKQFVVIATGIQWGKTTAGAWWLRNKVAKDPKANYIITAPTYKVLNQATVPAFLKVFEGVGHYHKGDQIFEIWGGGNIYIRTETEPNSIIGVTDVKAIWGDEAGLYRLYFWQNMQARVARLSGDICLTTSPYSLNWIYKELIQPALNGHRDDVHLCPAKSIDNPYFSKKFYEKMKRTMDPRMFNAIYNGQFEKMQGLVYDCFEESTNVIGHFDVPHGTVFHAGVDWGHNDPFVIIVWAITPEGQRIQISEFYKSNMSITEMCETALSLKNIYQIKRFWCDPSQPGMIKEFQTRGIPATGSDNDIDRGIQLVYELIKTEKLLLMANTSPHTIDEFSSYHWPEPQDLKPDQDVKKEKPVDQNNHCMDAVRYLALSTVYADKKLTPKVPGLIDKKQETTFEKIHRLKKPKPKFKKQEKWS
jgi:PBSX family phage terminase large subunit